MAVLVVSPLVCIAVICIPQAKAVQRGGPGQDYYWKYSNVDENLFKAAAYIYYSRNNELFGDQIDCLPQEVVMDYGTSVDDILAWAYPGGAFKDIYPEGSKKYCRISVNTRLKPEIRTNACLTFIHEYGHLLGKDHNGNIRSVMYDGYDKYKGLTRTRLFNRNIKLTLAKSVCNSMEIRGR